LKYLAGTVNLCIHYGRTEDGKIQGRELNRLWGWVDADFAADNDTRRSHTGYVMMMKGGPIGWKSAKQKSVSLSTAESEWYAAQDRTVLLLLSIVLQVRVKLVLLYLNCVFSLVHCTRVECECIGFAEYCT
jgi:hypothetical protein